MYFNSIDTIKEMNFFGFKKIEDLFQNPFNIPNERGVYMVLYLINKKPKFVEKGVGGFFKGKNPNQSIEELNNNWVENSIVIYIGQAGGIRNGKWSNATLSKRICTYLEFGQGKDIGHYGGRLIWQIQNYQELVLCWKTLPNKNKDPKEYEKELINEFKKNMVKDPLLTFWVRLLL